MCYFNIKYIDNDNFKYFWQFGTSTRLLEQAL